MTSQALSGVIALRLVSREGSPSLLEVRHKHTHTHTHEYEYSFMRTSTHLAGTMCICVRVRIHAYKYALRRTHLASAMCTCVQVRIHAYEYAFMRTSTHLVIRHIYHVAVLSFATSRLRPGILRVCRLVSVRRVVPRFLFCPTGSVSITV
jgi:hypothetical protein